jgi:hypothetical protein
LRAAIFVFQFLQRVNQRFGHETAAVRPEMALGIRMFGAGTFAHKAGINLAQRRQDAKEFILATDELR